MTSRRLPAVALVSLLFGLPLLLHAQELKLSDVPDVLPAAQKEALTDKKDELKSRWARYVRNKADLRKEFQGIREDDPRAPEVRKRMAAIRAQGEAVVEDTNLYHERVRALLSDSEIDARIVKTKEDLRGPELARALRAELDATTKRIESTKALIQKTSVRLLGYPEAIEEWSSLTEQARRDAHHAAVEAVATVVLEKLAIRNEEAILEDTDLLVRIAKSYRSILAVRMVAPIVWENLGRLETTKDVLTLASATKDALFGTAQIHEGLDREKTCSVLLKTLGMLNSMTVRDPRIGLLIADGELVIADVYLGVAQVVACKRVNQILDVQTDELKALTSLTSLYRADIDRRNRIRATLAGIK